MRIFIYYINTKTFKINLDLVQYFPFLCALQIWHCHLFFFSYNLAVDAIGCALERTDRNPIRCCWSAETRVSSLDCIYGKKPFQTRKCWSWWRRQEQLWSAWAGTLKGGNRQEAFLFFLMWNLDRHKCDSQNMYLQTVHWSHPVSESFASHWWWTKTPDLTLATKKTTVNSLAHVSTKTAQSTRTAAKAETTDPNKPPSPKMWAHLFVLFSLNTWDT